MRILVDMDDTIEQLLIAWIRVVNRRYGYATQFEDVTSWDVSAAFPGLTREQVYDVLLDDDFWMEVEPVPYAADVMQRLIGEGHELLIVTASPYESVAGKMKHVLFKYFPFLSWDQVIITTKKQLIRADLMIDDGVHNLEGADCIRILIDAPYNRGYDAEAGGMIRVKDWHEIETVLRRIGVLTNAV